MSISNTVIGGIGKVYVRKEGLFHIYTDRVGLHEFLQIKDYNFFYQLDPEYLKKRYGNRFIFWGGLEVWFITSL